MPAHADLQIVYQDGQYILSKDASVEGLLIPSGFVVGSVDSLNADQFALKQQYRTHLRYHPLMGKFFIFPLLSIDL